MDVSYANLEQRCESVFEKDVLRAILAKGFHRVRTQHKVGNYRIDIVVEGPESRLAVECDGDAWHSSERWDDDRIRQQKLERAGLTFERIRGSAFYRDPERALEALWSRLDELGIVPGDWGGGMTVTGTNRRVAKTMAERQTAGPPPDAPHTISLDSQLAIEEEEATAADEPAPVVLQAVPTTATATPATVTEAALDEAGPGAESAPRRITVEPPRRAGNVDLAPYESWTPRSVSSILQGPGDRVLADLLEIVSTEGPIHALRLYQIHAKAAGGIRVGREMRQQYNRLIHRALRAGTVRQVDDDLVGVIDKTLYLPGTPSVVVRGLGPRQLIEVPRSEVATLARRLEASGTGDTKRAVLDALGLKRLRQRTSEYLDECLDYTWRPGSGNESTGEQ